MKLSIIIIHYKSENIIEKCISSIRYDDDYEVIVVDNGGNPELMEKISRLKNVRTIDYTGNHGFAKANNIAIKQAQGEYIMTLNADVFLKDGYIDKCVKFLENNFIYASVQGKLILNNERALIDSTGNMVTKSRFAQNINHREKDIELPSTDVFGVCAAAAVYRKKYLDQAVIFDEYFDEDFFAYLEDVDLDWRLNLLGYKSHFLGNIHAYHIREMSSNKMYRVKQAMKNKIYLIIKNDVIWSVILNFLLGLIILAFISNRRKNYILIFKMIKKRFVISKKSIIKKSDITKNFPTTPWSKMFKKLFN